ncbi:transferrin-binding protein-like solute binding protein [Iodidimonas sp. SYSU 1G8]|uniref:transferrin-binding protein-like solute binding protein n=1 Tax=Iodidimonas sp. SYSU 1G8 TaxID=3133967 RepID=UPI0031FF31BD
MTFISSVGTNVDFPEVSQESFAAGNTIIYDADNDSFRLNITTGLAQVDATFTPDDIQETPETRIIYYRNGSATLVLAKAGDEGTGLSYVTTGNWSVSPSLGSERGYLVFGIPTSDDSMPITGSATYAGLAGGYLVSSGQQFGLRGTSSLTADFASGVVNGELVLTKQAPLTQEETPWNALSVTGTIAGSGFEGTVQSGDGKLTGPVSGGFFGPGAAETGGSWSAESTIEHATGTFTGKR